MDTIPMPHTAYIGLAVTSHHTGMVASAEFDGVRVEVDVPPPPPALPTGWFSQDVGAVGAVGSVTAAGGTWIVSGSGADVWDTTDEFRYVYRTWTGDGTIVARVTALTAADEWTKAGVMMRASLAPDAAHAFMFTTPGVNGLAYQRRPATAGRTLHSDGGGGSPPAWVALTRSGDDVHAFRSDDGVTWIWLGVETIPMPPTLYIGVAVTSHTDGTVASATFDGVDVRAF
jgi:hypothetical protein